MTRIEEEISIEKSTAFLEAWDFEVYDLMGTIRLLRKYRPIMYLTVVVYLLTIYYGRKWMENRRSFELKIPLFFWNFGLAVFSIIATFRLMPEIFYSLAQPDGLYQSICVLSPHSYATSFWALLFLLSKFVELGDTAFIVLRKQKLIVLHWFHHVATLSMCWIGFETYDAVSRYIFFNTFVHSFMYSYYALKALKVKIPKRLSKALTILQIVQMFAGLYLAISTANIISQGRPCRVDTSTLRLGGVIISIFTVLFINFFWKTYYCSAKDKGIKSE